jgi:hypothetical protein
MSNDAERLGLEPDKIPQQTESSVAAPSTPSAESVTSTLPAEGERILLSPIQTPTQTTVQPDPATEAKYFSRIGFLDGFLFLLLLVFGFTLACFPATNSDLFLNLATGRLVATFQGGLFTDPFTFTASGFWGNHQWLSQLLGYLVFILPHPIGGEEGAGLIVLKSLVVVVIAWLLAEAGNLPGRRSWIALGCAFLALLTMSPRFLLQPAVLSMLFLALTVTILFRRSHDPRSLWYLPIVCLVWVNMDTWFMMGPIAILLFLIGENLQERKDTPEATPRPDFGKLGVVFVACLVACLCSPNHVRAFASLPTGLWPYGDMAPFAADSIYRSYFLSPVIDASLYFTPAFGLSPAGIAFVVLFVLSLFSFLALAVWSNESVRLSRVLLWVAFAFLGAANIRAIPFFAIIAGPITALNFLDLAAKLVGTDIPADPVWRRWGVSGRNLSILIALLVIVIGIPGWLQSRPHSRRMFGVGIEVDQGLKATAKQVARWREEGLIDKGTHWLNTRHEVAAYLAWYCPGEKCYLDQRLELFTPLSREFKTLRGALSGVAVTGEEIGDEATKQPAWRSIFREHKVRFLVVYGDRQGISPDALLMYGNPDEFIPCHIEGTTTIFAWQDPRPGSDKIDPRLAVDFDALAFGKAAVKAPAVPVRGPDSPPWLAALLEVEPRQPVATGTALQNSARFESLLPTYQRQFELRYISSMRAGLSGTAAGYGGPIVNGTLLQARIVSAYNVLYGGSLTSPGFPEQFAFFTLETYRRSYDLGPSASLYLAIRQARTALADSPDDAQSQYVLARAYTDLMQKTRERSAVSVFVPQNRQEMPILPQVQSIRRTQVAVALRNYLKVHQRPDRRQIAHFLLAENFNDPRYLELRLIHLQQYYDLSKQLRSLLGVTPEKYADVGKALEDELRELKAEIQKRRDAFEGKRAVRSTGMEQALAALNSGLVETAKEILLEAPKEELMAKNPGQLSGVSLLIELLLSLGEIDYVVGIFAQPKEDEKFDVKAFGYNQFGLPSYLWFQVQIGASLGDYKLAQEQLDACLAMYDKSADYLVQLGQLDLLPDGSLAKIGTCDEHMYTGLLVGKVMMNAFPKATGQPWQLALRMPALNMALGGQEYLNVIHNQKATLWTLKSWLAMEAGNVEDARAYSLKAFSLFKVGETADKEPLCMPFRAFDLARLMYQLSRKAVEGQGK